MNIIKGTNEPIVLEFDENIEALKASALLYSTDTSCCDKKFKHWDKEDMIVSDNIIQLPLYEEETLHFVAGMCALEFKLLDENNKVVLYNIVKGKIVDRKDGTMLMEVYDDEDEGG